MKSRGGGPTQQMPLEILRWTLFHTHKYAPNHSLSLFLSLSLSHTHTNILTLNDQEGRLCAFYHFSNRVQDICKIGPAYGIDFALRCCTKTRVRSHGEGKQHVFMAEALPHSD